MVQQDVGFVDLYDETPGYDDSYEISLKSGLTDVEIEEAMVLQPFMRGVMIITGPPRSGKDLFGNVFAWKQKRFFGRTILRDERPRRLFGEYEPFNEVVLMQEIVRMKQVAIGAVTAGLKKHDIGAARELRDASVEWLTQYGQVKLKNAVLYLTEFYRYFHNRQPFNPMGIALGPIVKQWGHLDLLIIGTAQQRHELDRYSCLPYVTHEVRCKWSLTKQNTGLYNVRRTRYVLSTGTFEVDSGITPWIIDGGRERDALDGKRYFDLFNSKSAPQLKPNIKFEL